MDFTDEMLEKAKEANTPEELFMLAKENDIEIPKEEAERLFSLMHRYDSQPSEELSDEELTNVSAGYGRETTCDTSGDTPLYKKGDYVYFYYIDGDNRRDYEGVIIYTVEKGGEFCKEWKYHIANPKDYNSYWNYYYKEFNIYEHQIYRAR